MGVLGVALDDAERVLGPVDADAERHHAQVVGEVDAADTLFSDDATALIHQVSRGNSRAG